MVLNGWADGHTSAASPATRTRSRTQQHQQQRQHDDDRQLPHMDGTNDNPRREHNGNINGRRHVDRGDREQSMETTPSPTSGRRRVLAPSPRSVAVSSVVPLHHRARVCLCACVLCECVRVCVSSRLHTTCGTFAGCVRDPTSTTTSYCHYNFNHVSLTHLHNTRGAFGRLRRLSPLHLYHGPCGVLERECCCLWSNSPARHW
jgi:hypothetical protein